MNKQFKILVLITGLLIAGEATALLLGMYWLSPQPNPWLTIPNKFILLADMLLGFMMLVYVYGTRSRLPDGVFLIITDILLLLHICRDLEYFLGFNAAPFLLNVPLMLVNNIKLLGLVMALIFYKQRFRN